MVIAFKLAGRQGITDHKQRGSEGQGEQEQKSSEMELHASPKACLGSLKGKKDAYKN